jgi:hypothetical protein
LCLPLNSQNRLVAMLLKTIVTNVGTSRVVGRHESAPLPRQQDERSQAQSSSRSTERKVPRQANLTDLAEAVVAKKQRHVSLSLPVQDNVRRNANQLNVAPTGPANTVSRKAAR